MIKPNSNDNDDDIVSEPIWAIPIAADWPKTNRTNRTTTLHCGGLRAGV